MASAATKVSVFNIALDIVVEAPCVTGTEDRAAVNFLNRNWRPVVAMELRANIWSFATERLILSADTWTSTDDWLYRFSWPAEALRVLSPTSLGKRGYPPIPYTIKRGKIYANQTPPLKADFIMDVVETPGEWDDIFVSVVAAELALRMAHRFTGKTSFIDRAKGLKDEAMELAVQVDAIEAGMDPIEQHDIIQVRAL